MLIFYFFKDFETEACAMLESLEGLFKEWVIVEKGLLKVLDRSQIQTLDITWGRIDRFEVVTLVDVLLNQAIVYRCRVKMVSKVINGS